MDIMLTKESRKVLKTIYDIYSDRRKSGQSKSAAMRFDASDAADIPSLADAAPELKKAGFLKRYITGNFELTDQAIIFMENFTKDTVLKWLEFGSNFIP